MARRTPQAVSAQTLFDALVSLCVLALTLLVMLNPAAPRVAIVLGVGMAAALLWRRSLPLPAMAAVAALALVQVLTTPARYDPMPFDAAVVIAMYSVVKYARSLWHGVVAGGVVAVGIAVEIVRHSSRPPWVLGAMYAAICGAVWLAGYTVRVRRLYVAQLEERAATAERERDHLSRLATADERASIARELHDLVAHSLAVMIVQADGAGYAMDRDPRTARAAIRQVAATGRESLVEMRRLLGVLRGDPRPGAGEGPEVGGTGDGDDAVDRRRLGAEALDELLERARSAGVHTTLAVTGDRPDVPAGVDLAVYRIVQEALTNVLRHAGGGPAVRVDLAYAAQSVHVLVRDDGGSRAGPPPRAEHGGHGLIGMRERVNVYGGSFDAGPDGTGWQVAATLPWPEPARHPDPAPAARVTP